MAADNVLPIRPLSFEVRMRNVRTRMPGKYGATIALGFPLAHLRLTVEGPQGRRVVGLAGDCLPPGWYDKRPNRTFAQDVEELSAALREAGATLLALAKGGPQSVFSLWRELYAHQIDWARRRDIADITGNFGTSMLERALIDAAGKLSGQPFHACVKENLLGLDPGAVLPFLKGWTAAEALAPKPLDSIFVRHTVGGLDPLVEQDVPPGKRLADGLPQTLEEYLREERLRYFKVKLHGHAAEDIERVRGIAAVLDRTIPASERYYITLDGNEQFADPANLVDVLEKMSSESGLARFAQATLFVEQPYPRALALQDGIKAELARASRLKPVILDESDENAQSVSRGLELGYAGFAIKSAKGPLKALLNVGATRRHPKRPAAPVVSGEDMANLPVIPLHEDLVLMAALGIPHVERNGHHFCRGLDHLSASEREALLKAHPGLYHRKTKDLAALATESGALDVRTLNARPGFGIDDATEVDGASMTPLDDWKFESLGIG